MTQPSIRIYERADDGTVTDLQQEFDLSSFAGQMPAIGDTIVVPGVLQGLDRHELANRRFWTVVERVFNPRDLEGYVALVVEERTPSRREAAVVTG